MFWSESCTIFGVIIYSISIKFRPFIVFVLCFNVFKTKGWKEHVMKGSIDGGVFNQKPSA